MTKIKDIIRDLNNLDPEMDVKNYSIDIVEEDNYEECLDYKVIGQAYGIVSKVAFLIASGKYEGIINKYQDNDEDVLKILENTILDLDDEVLDEDNYQVLVNFIYNCTGKHYEIDIPDEEDDEILDAPGIDIEEEDDNLVIRIPVNEWNEAARRVAEENSNEDFEASIKAIVKEIGKALNEVANED